MCLGFALALQILFTALRTFLKNEATDESEKAERRTREKPAGQTDVGRNRSEPKARKRNCPGRNKAGSMMKTKDRLQKTKLENRHWAAVRNPSRNG